MDYSRRFGTFLIVCLRKSTCLFKVLKSRYEVCYYITNSSNVLRAMSALIAISDGEGSLDCAALAVGQSRHLGGGFLVPLDFPKNMIVPDGHFEKGVPSWLK